MPLGAAKSRSPLHHRAGAGPARLYPPIGVLPHHVDSKYLEEPAAINARAEERGGVVRDLSSRTLVVYDADAALRRVQLLAEVEPLTPANKISG